MNSLNPNIKEALLASTNFKSDQIRIAFDHLKAIETDSHKEFVLTEEKFIAFVERCRDRRWPCDIVASKLSARVKLNYGAGFSHGETFSFRFSDGAFRFDDMDGLREWMKGNT